MTIPWDEIESKVLAAAPNAKSLLAVVKALWSGSLTEDIANAFIAFFAKGQYAEAKKLLLGGANAQQIIEADLAENDALAAMVARDKKVYDFLGDLQGALLKVALGVALAAVGL